MSLRRQELDQQSEIEAGPGSCGLQVVGSSVCSPSCSLKALSGRLGPSWQGLAGGEPSPWSPGRFSVGESRGLLPCRLATKEPGWAAGGVGAGLETFGIGDVMARLLWKAFFVVSVGISWYI